MTLIPQDAVLYSGTIRENLDPFKQYTDAECIEALRMVHLPVDAVAATAPGESATVITLESKVSDGAPTGAQDSVSSSLWLWVILNSNISKV